MTLVVRVAHSIVNDHHKHELKSMYGSAKRFASLSGGGRNKHQPRINLLTKLELNHITRLGSTTFGVASRTPAMLAVIRMQLRLSTHPYASVRAEAQSGFASALRSHPWLARSSLHRPIKLLSSPTAQSHETKGAIFLLSTRVALKRAASDYSLLSAMLVSLVDARDHKLPKLQQRSVNI